MDEKFTSKAKTRWNSIPPQIQKTLLSNVWCSNCAKATTITNFGGTIEGGDLILRGTCKRCGNKVARVIESEG